MADTAAAPQPAAVKRPPAKPAPDLDAVLDWTKRGGPFPETRPVSDSPAQPATAIRGEKAHLPPEIVAAARRGWRVHPVKARSKIAVLKDWQYKATSDLAQIKAWSRQYRGCNWGAVAGPESGFFAVDVGDPAAMQKLEDEHGPIPEGLCVVTSRGYALVYRWPDADVRPGTNRPCKGIDIRGRDSYIVIPPSVHPNGHAYHYSDDSLPIPECPAWLMALILNRAQESAQERQSAPAAGAVVGKGQRTKILSRMIGKLHSDGVPADSIEAAALALNATFNPPLPDEKIRKNLVEYMTKHYPAGSPLPRVRRGRSICSKVRRLSSGMSQ